MEKAISVVFILIINQFSMITKEQKLNIATRIKDRRNQYLFYPRDVAILVTYIGILNYLKVSELDEFNALVLNKTTIRRKELVDYALKNVVDKIKNSPRHPEDFIILYYVKFNGKISTYRLIHDYYNKFIRDKLEHLIPKFMFDEETPTPKIRKKEKLSDKLQMKLEF